MVPVSYKKGFVFTILTLMLFLILISFAVALKSASLDKSNSGGQTSASRKVVLTWYDIYEDIPQTINITIIKNGPQLQIIDTLPNNGNYFTYLIRYYNFVTAYYLTPELTILFLDGNNNTIDINSLGSPLTIYPFGITYSYPNNGQRLRDIQCPQNNCTALLMMNYQYNFTNAAFACSPLNCSCHDHNVGGCGGGGLGFHWAPNKMLNSCNAGQSCVNFSMAITDNQSQVYTCPGPFCPFTAYNLGQKSTLQVDMVGCKLSVQFGGNQAGNQFIEEVRLIPAGGGCNTNITTSVNFTFNTANYYFNFPTQLKITDINYNISKQDNIISLPS